MAVQEESGGAQPSPIEIVGGDASGDSGRQRSRNRTRVVRFHCNGDRFYQGKRVYINPKRYLTVEQLMMDLTKKFSTCVRLPFGVRQIFSTDGRRRITSVKDLIDGSTYICAGYESFKPISTGYEIQRLRGERLSD